MHNGVHIEVNEISNALSHAAAVTLLLAERGVAVVAAMTNGRRPLLVVNRMPEGIESAVKRTEPNGLGGRTVVRAAAFHGCQLEAMQDVPGHREPVRLQVVRHG